MDQQPPEYDPDDRYWDELDASYQWLDDEIRRAIREDFDEYRREHFRARVADWSASRFPAAEAIVLRVGKESRAHLVEGHDGPALVWAATAIELILRELALKPIFVGLFLGDQWADRAVVAMLRGRWLRDDVRKVARDVLQAVAELDVEQFEFNGHRVWRDYPSVLEARHKIVHEGAMACRADAERAVDIAAGLYMLVVPHLRELCGVTEVAGYAPPEGVI
jgi:hypothetical protein